MKEENKNKEKTFEENILELENLVKKLETGNCEYVLMAMRSLVSNVDSFSLSFS